jgi:hypothetical protein
MGLMRGDEDLIPHGKTPGLSADLHFEVPLQDKNEFVD